MHYVLASAALAAVAPTALALALPVQPSTVSAYHVPRLSQFTPPANDVPHHPHAPHHTHTTATPPAFHVPHNPHAPHHTHINTYPPTSTHTPTHTKTKTSAQPTHTKDPTEQLQQALDAAGPDPHCPGGWTVTTRDGVPTQVCNGEQIPDSVLHPQGEHGPIHPRVERLPRTTTPSPYHVPHLSQPTPPAQHIPHHPHAPHHTHINTFPPTSSHTPTHTKKTSTAQPTHSKSPGEELEALNAQLQQEIDAAGPDPACPGGWTVAQSGVGHSPHQVCNGGLLPYSAVNPQGGPNHRRAESSSDSADIDSEHEQEDEDENVAQSGLVSEREAKKEHHARPKRPLTKEQQAELLKEINQGIPNPHATKGQGEGIGYFGTGAGFDVV